MQSIIQIIRQRIIYYNNLKNLKRANNTNLIKLYSIFVKKFALFKNTKEREILNFINTKIENFDNIVKKKNTN